MDAFGMDTIAEIPAHNRIRPTGQQNEKEILTGTKKSPEYWEQKAGKSYEFGNVKLTMGVSKKKLAT